MEIRQFLVTLRRHWFIPLLILLGALAGTYGYNRVTNGETAQATVAVLDPLVARQGAYGEAQITLDAIIKSHRLAERVGPRVGMNPDLVTGRLSVAVLPTLSTVNVSPLYAVRGKDRSAAQAIRLTNVAVDEARKLYTELNSNEFQSADAQFKTARDALSAFQVANPLPDLASLLQQEGQLASVGQAQRLASGGRGSRVSAATSAELDRLSSLVTQYSDLSFAVQVAQQRVLVLNQGRTGQVVSDLLMKVLDRARIKSQFTTILLNYGVALLLALLVGATIIYLLAVFHKSPETAADVSRALKAPVLVRIPRASSRS